MTIPAQTTMIITPSPADGLTVYIEEQKAHQERGRDRVRDRRGSSLRSSRSRTRINELITETQAKTGNENQESTSPHEYQARQNSQGDEYDQGEFTFW